MPQLLHRRRVAQVEELGEVHYTGLGVRDNGRGGKASLEPNHSAFVLVDSACEAWGGEIELRAAVERLICEVCAAWCMCMVHGACACASARYAPRGACPPRPAVR